jgi:hypothetical protein
MSMMMYNPWICAALRHNISRILPQQEQRGKKYVPLLWDCSEGFEGTNDGQHVSQYHDGYYWTIHNLCQLWTDHLACNSIPGIRRQTHSSQASTHA